MNSWIEQLEKEFYGLEGAVVNKWDCIEVALSEDPLRWNNPDIEYLQCDRIDIHFKDGTVFSLITCQNNDEFGLYMKNDLSPIDVSDNPLSIFKYRILDELPAGKIKEVFLKKSGKNNISTLCLTINDKKVSFFAAEVDQHSDGYFFIREMDESILVQLNGRKP